MRDTYVFQGRSRSPSGGFWRPTTVKQPLITDDHKEKPGNSLKHREGCPQHTGRDPSGVRNAVRRTALGTPGRLRGLDHGLRLRS